VYGGKNLRVAVRPDKNTCAAIMTTAPFVVGRSRTIADAMRMLLDDRLLALPVVDDEGRYLGMFLRSRLVALLLPKIVQIEDTIPEVGRLVEVGFISDTIEDVRGRFMSVADEPVEKFMNTDTPVLRPDTPIMNAVLFLYRTRTYLPVVEEASGKLVGVVSTWDILARIAGHPTR
jgi:CBS-domain-containing membrane protein